MHIHWNRVLLTTLLGLILAGVILVELVVFISGPNRKYEQDITSVEAKIVNRYNNIENLDRHVFRYTTYHGVDDDVLRWFDKDGNLLMKRDLSDDQSQKAYDKAINKYQMKQAKVYIGYGYKNAVYIVKDKYQIVFYDFDNLKQIYYREGNV